MLLGFRGVFLMTFTGNTFRYSIQQHWLSSFWQN